MPTIRQVTVFNVHIKNQHFLEVKAASEIPQTFVFWVCKS